METISYKGVKELTLNPVSEGPIAYHVPDTAKSTANILPDWNDVYMYDLNSMEWIDPTGEPGFYYHNDRIICIGYDSLMIIDPYMCNSQYGIKQVVQFCEDEGFRKIDGMNFLKRFFLHRSKRRKDTQRVVDTNFDEDTTLEKIRVALTLAIRKASMGSASGLVFKTLPKIVTRGLFVKATAVYLSISLLHELLTSRKELTLDYDTFREIIINLAKRV